MTYPFLFLGQGFAKSFRQLQLFVVFEKKPGSADLKNLKPLLPKPLQISFKFDSNNLFSLAGKGGELKDRVKHAYCKTYQTMTWEQASKKMNRRPLAKLSGDFDPTLDEWKSFCQDCEKALIEIHEILPIKFVYKADDNNKKLGAWNRWSIKNITPVLEFFTQAKKSPSRQELIFAYRLVYDLLESSPIQTNKKDGELWIRWMNRVLNQNSEFQFQFAVFGGKIWKQLDQAVKTKMRKLVPQNTMQSFEQ